MSPESKKNIILVSSAFYPEISPRSYRATELAKEFCRQGHNVTVISKFRNFDYAKFLKKYPMGFKMWSKPKLPEIPSFKRSPFRQLSRIISRGLLLFFEYPAIQEMFFVRNILKRESEYDLLISFSVPYPVHWGVAWARTKKHSIAHKWIADCGDPFMGDVLDSYRKMFYFGYLEKWFGRKADYITIPVEGAKDAYYPEFRNKIRIIPQGFNFDLNKNNDIKTENKIPNFSYAGSFLPGARNPEPMMNFLSNLDIPFKFYVFTNRPEIIIPYQEKLNGKLEVSNYIPREKLLKVLKEMDFLINFDNNTSKNSPSKLIDYAIINRPVLNITHNFQGDELLQFLQGNYEQRMLLPDPEQYHISKISKKFLELTV